MLVHAEPSLDKLKPGSHLRFINNLFNAGIDDIDNKFRHSFYQDYHYYFYIIWSLNKLILVNLNIFINKFTSITRESRQRADCLIAKSRLSLLLTSILRV